jgi:hypothetical protein
MACTRRRGVRSQFVDGTSLTGIVKALYGEYVATQLARESRIAKSITSKRVRTVDEVPTKALLDGAYPAQDPARGGRRA